MTQRPNNLKIFDVEPKTHFDYSAQLYRCNYPSIPNGVGLSLRSAQHPYHFSTLSSKSADTKEHTVEARANIGMDDFYAFVREKVTADPAEYKLSWAVKFKEPQHEPVPCATELLDTLSADDLYRLILIDETGALGFELADDDQIPEDIVFAHDFTDDASSWVSEAVALNEKANPELRTKISSDITELLAHRILPPVALLDSASGTISASK